MDRKAELIKILGNAERKFVNTDPANMDWRKRIATLVSSWEMGLTDSQAASEAGITVQTVRNMLNDYPELVELKEICSENLRINARKNVRDAIKRGHLETSKWYLERTDPGFQRNGSDTTVNVAVISVTDREKELNKFMERFTDAGVIESVAVEK